MRKEGGEKRGQCAEGASTEGNIMSAEEREQKAMDGWGGPLDQPGMKLGVTSRSASQHTLLSSWKS